MRETELGRKHRGAAQRDDLARWVVRKRFEVLATHGAEHSMEQVAEAADAEGVDVRSAKDAYRLFWHAIDGGLIRIHIQDTPRRSEHKEDGALGSRLTQLARDGCPALRRVQVRVVRVAHGAETLSDDELHLRLGDHAGRAFLATELVDGDRLAVTAGRAVAAAIQALSEERGLGGLTLYAMTGSTERGVGAVLGTSLDADSLVRNAVAGCAPGEVPRVRLVTLPAGLPDTFMQRTGAEGEFLRETAGYLLEDWWVKRKPQVTLLGASPLSSDLVGKHPLWITRNPFIRKGLDKMTKVLSDHEADGLCIGEMALRLWVISAPDTPGAEEAAAICEELNTRLVGPTFDALSHGRKRIVVAGGPQKVELLESLLRGGTAPCFPSVVFIDHEAATLLEPRLARTQT